MADVLADAQRLYNESLDASRDQRLQIQEDIEFSDPSNPRQWDETIKLQRENDPGGRRPCLVMDQINQYVSNVAGQIEQQPPAIHAIPVGNGADKEAAEQIDGRFRHIEYASKASQHYQRSLTAAARTGVGYLVVRPVSIDRTLNIQEPRIGSEPDPLKVVFDPWSVDTDGCDADFGFILTATNPSVFERRWPGKEQKDFGDTEATRRTDLRKSILVAEGWSKESTTRNMILHADADGQTATLPEADFWAAHKAGNLAPQPVPPRTFLDKTSKVMWRRMSGADVLEEAEYLADYIGIVPVYGYVAFVDGRMRYCGIPRRGRAPQQAYNYHMSESLAYIGTSPRSTWLASKRATKGVEKIWDRAASEARAWLPHNDLDEEGAIAAPTRISPSINLGNHTEGAQQALRDIQAAIGLYQANLGAPSNETSGVAIEGRKAQGEASTAHFPSHMQASIGQVGQIVMQMDARLADTKRQQPIVGIDGTPGHVTVDPKQKTAFSRTPDGVTVNPKVGTYGVRVVVGASYTTQRTQTNAAFSEIMRGNPSLAPTVAPFWAQTLDFPGADKFAQALAAMAPPPVKAILQPEGSSKGPDPAALAQQLDQCKQALTEAIGHAQAAQQDADQAIGAAADAKRLASVRERELDIEAYNAATARLKVTGANPAELQAIVQGLVMQMLQQPGPMPGDQVPSAPVAAGQGVSASPSLPTPSSLGASAQMPAGLPPGVPSGAPGGQMPGTDPAVNQPQPPQPAAAP